MIVKQEDLMNILDSTWAFKVKLFLNSTLSKLKAYPCVHGDQQIDGVDVFNTYAPVVNFITVWLLLVLSIRFGWAMVQIDYTAAFINAKVDEDVFAEMPRGYCKEGHVIN
eukprot:4954186-Ditylum_brightwellii.AAC.1